jgi:ABC-type sugar transport system permease subunit
MTDALLTTNTASILKKRKKAFWQGQKGNDNLTYLIFLLPGALLIITFAIYPILMVFFLSVNDIDNAIDPPKWYGLQNFIWAIKNPYFIQSLSSTLIFTVLSVSGSTGFGIFLAALLNQEKLRSRDFFRSIYLYAWLVPEVIAAVVFRFVFASNFGLLNNILASLGLPQPAWLNNPHLALFTLVMVNVWRGIPFNILVYLTALQTVNKEWLESAELDGANGWQKFRYISFATLRPTIVTTSLLGIIWASNTFFLPYVMTDGGPLNSTRLWSLLIYQNFFDFPTHISRASAISVFVYLILFVFGLVYFALTRKINEEVG